jgi:septum formation topological specificity factor MinE
MEDEIPPKVKAFIDELTIRKELLTVTQQYFDLKKKYDLMMNVMISQSEFLFQIIQENIQLQRTQNEKENQTEA